MAGKLVISLDFELFWGVRDHRTVQKYGPNILGGRSAIPRMLEQFVAHGIRATWATVGMVFCATKEELLASVPEHEPTYDDRRLSPFGDLDRVGADEHADPLHFGASLVRRIAESPGQELATHTFSHYFALEPGQQPQQFAADLDAALAVARRNGVTLRSIVFPRNQVNADYLPICRDRGLVAFRGTQPGWMHTTRATSRESALRRAARLGDAHVPLVGRTSYEAAPPNPADIGDVPASRFLRPRSSALRPLRGLLLRRIEHEMSVAAAAERVYHLWWHPHNFGVDVEGHLGDLERLLRHYDRLRDDHGMEARSMAEVATGT